ncbi:MAG: SH3 domain-containing protein [Phenylobacterium sp.]
MKTQSILTRGAAAGLAALALSAGAVAPASAQGIGSGVVNCGAPGNKQIAGAVIGALAGGALGSNLAKNDRGTGTAIGAVAGAATGSYVGCRMQRSDAGRQAGYYGERTYSHGGYRLSGDLQPASFSRDGDLYVAETTVNLRAAPTTGSGRVGQLRAGEQFEALARVRNSPWILVGQDGVGVGYVHENYVSPARAGRATYARY